VLSLKDSRPPGGGHELSAVTHIDCGCAVFLLAQLSPGKAPQSNGKTKEIDISRCRSAPSCGLLRQSKAHQRKTLFGYRSAGISSGRLHIASLPL